MWQESNKQAVDWQIDKYWNMTFCHQECFPDPNPLAVIGKLPEPPIFALYPYLKQLIHSFCLSNLIVDLMIETVQDYIITIAIPDCIKCHVGDITREGFLKQCRLKKISQPMVCCWMTILNFSYCDHCKMYYIDGHEWDDIVKY